MVDLFNNETNTGRPAVDIVRILVLQSRENAFESFEVYNKNKNRGIQADQSTLRARLLTWFMQHQAYIERNSIDTKEEIEELLFKEQDIKDSEIKKILYFLNAIIDKLNITKLDTHRIYDRTNIEEDNKENDL